MRKIRKALALALCLGMTLALLAACGPADTGTGTAPGGAGTSTAPPQQPGAPVGTGDGDLTEAAPDEPDVVFAEHIDVILPNENFAVLNPLSPAANSTATDMVFILIHDRLLERNPDTGEYLPALARDWNTEDYQTFVFNLREDVFFHNGDQFTAQDVINTVELAREIGAGSQGAAQWAPIETNRAIDEFTIEIVLGAVNVDFYFNLTIPAAGILNRRAIEEDSENGTWIGTGAFIVTEFLSNDLTRLARNDNYWNTDRNILTPTMTIRFVPEMGVRAVRLQSGDSQISFGTGSEDIPLFQADPEYFNIVPHTFNSLTGISFNMNDPLMADYYFRKAVMHAANRVDIAYFAAGDWAMPACNLPDGSIWGFQTEFRNNNIPIIEFDQELARDYLMRSSYNGETIQIAAAIATAINGAQALQEQLRQVGISAYIQEMDTPGLNAYMLDPQGGSQIVFHSLAMNLSSSSYRLAFYPGGPQNRMHYDNPEVSRMLVEAATMTDTNARRDHFLRIQEIVFADAPFFNMYHRVNPVVAVNGLGGVGLTAENRQIDLREIFLIVD
ncbi:MAG: ABC transporter substrate-binding protein [Oscillospiraceae bacterium]|nr:ABC transporter substrate-binding protein [Oscillospiraceae bacterium]